MWLVSTLRGYFLAHSMHVVTPGNASSRAAAMGMSHRLHSLRVDFCFELMTTSRCARQPLRVRHAIVRPAYRGDHRVKWRRSPARTYRPDRTGQVSGSWAL